MRPKPRKRRSRMTTRPRRRYVTCATFAEALAPFLTSGALRPDDSIPLLTTDEVGSDECARRARQRAGNQLSTWKGSRPMTTPDLSDAEAAELPAVLTPDDLAALLRVRKRAVLDAIQRGELPGVRRVGRRIRADPDTGLRWLADGRGQSPRSRLFPR